jgi:hypothetical protein
MCGVRMTWVPGRNVSNEVTTFRKILTQKGRSS